MKLIPCGNIPAILPADLMAHTVLISLNWGWLEDSSKVTVDASLFLLKEDGRVYDDRAMVFYGQPTDPSLAVFYQPSNLFNQDHFQVALPIVPADVRRIMLCLTLEATASTPTFNALALIQVQMIHPVTGDVLMNYHSQGKLGTERGRMVAEIYRENDGWTFRAVNEGFSGRLAALAESFGIVMEEDELPCAIMKDPAQDHQVTSLNTQKGLNPEDCTCRMMLHSQFGTTGCDLLNHLSKKMLLQADRLKDVLIEDLMRKVHSMRALNHCCPLMQADIQDAVAQALLSE